MEWWQTLLVASIPVIVTAISTASVQWLLHSYKLEDEEKLSSKENDIKKQKIYFL